MKSSTSLNNGYFLPSPEADNDADYLSFGTPEKSDDGVNDNIQENKVTREDYDEVYKDVYDSLNRNSDSIGESIAGRVLRAWVIRKSYVESNFSIAVWFLSVQTEIMDNVKRDING